MVWNVECWISFKKFLPNLETAHSAYKQVHTVYAVLKRRRRRGRKIGGGVQHCYPRSLLRLPKVGYPRWVTQGGLPKVGYPRWVTQGGLPKVGYPSWVTQAGLQSTDNDLTTPV